MEEAELNENDCVICLNGFAENTEQATTVTKGIDKLIDYSQQ